MILTHTVPGGPGTRRTPVYQAAGSVLLTREMTGEEPEVTMLESAEDRIEIHTVKNPASGQTVEIGAGNRLDVRFTHVGMTARWEIVARPHNLVPLAIGRTSFSFLAFRSNQPVQELVLRKVGVRGEETRTLRVVTVP